MSNNESFLQAQLTGQQLLNTQLQNRITQQITTISQLQLSTINYQKEVLQLKQELAKLKGETFSHTEKTADIGKDVDYQKNLKEQSLILAEWMLSQKAFKELAIILGEEKGWTYKTVIEKGNELKEKVLNNEFNPKHGTNANGVPLLENSKESLMKKISSSK